MSDIESGAGGLDPWMDDSEILATSEELRVLYNAAKDVASSHGQMVIDEGINVKDFAEDGSPVSDGPMRSEVYLSRKLIEEQAPDLTTMLEYGDYIKIEYSWPHYSPGAGEPEPDEVLITMHKDITQDPYHDTETIFVVPPELEVETYHTDREYSEREIRHDTDGMDSEDRTKYLQALREAAAPLNALDCWALTSLVARVPSMVAEPNGDPLFVPDEFLDGDSDLDQSE